jgi:hypothetical protein
MGSVFLHLFIIIHHHPSSFIIHHRWNGVSLNDFCCSSKPFPMVEWGNGGMIILPFHRSCFLPHPSPKPFPMVEWGNGE